MDKRKLIQDQLDSKFILFQQLAGIAVPPSGWIFSIRKGINMTLKQLGKRLSITPQSVRGIEEREKDGTVSMKVLRQVAAALDMQFVYGFVPKDKTLAGMIERKAYELAGTIVDRTSIQMEIEDQKVTDKRLKKAIKEKAEELIRETPSILWD